MHGERIVIAAFLKCEITIKLWMSCKKACLCVPFACGSSDFTSVISPKEIQERDEPEKYKSGL